VPDQLSEYYPLVPGNTWKFRISAPGDKRTPTATLFVSSGQRFDFGSQFILTWRHENDDEDNVFDLVLTSKGIHFDSEGKRTLIRFPMKESDEWHYRGFDYSHNQWVQTRNRVLTVGAPCTSAGKTYKDCVVIQTDEEGVLRRVTVYARRIGPVKIIEYRWGTGEPESIPSATFELVSHHLVGLHYHPPD
jgi:hypothetical protein